MKKYILLFFFFCTSFASVTAMILTPDELDWIGYKISNNSSPWLRPDELDKSKVVRNINFITWQKSEYLFYRLYREYDLNKMRIYLTQEGRRILKNQGDLGRLSTGIDSLDKLNSKFKVTDAKVFKGWGKVKGIELTFSENMNIEQLQRIYVESCHFVKRVRCVGGYHPFSNYFKVVSDKHSGFFTLSFVTKTRY